MLAILLAPNSTKYGTSLEVTTIPYGFAFGVGTGTDFVSPVAMFSFPTMSAPCTVKKMFPLSSNIGVCGSRSLGSIVYP